MKRILSVGALSLALSASLLGPAVARAEEASGNGVFQLPVARALALDHVARGGELRTLAPGVDRPRSLAAADLDEDGVPDLVCGYGSGLAGFVAVHRGNVESIMASPRMAGVPGVGPFLGPALVFDLRFEPSFLGSGDFDADGHWDVVAAAQGDDGLYLMTGNGHGQLHAPRRITVPGTITALLAGDVNRMDGLTDLVVGIGDGAGPAVLVFEGPQGALHGSPELIMLPDAPTSLAIGMLGADAPIDIAVGAGDNLWIVRGRDRRLSLDPEKQAEVGPASVLDVALPAAVRGVAIGDFLPAVSSDYSEEIAVLDRGGNLHLLAPEETEAAPERWVAVCAVTVGAPAGETLGAASLLRGRFSGHGEELLVLDSSARGLGLYSAGASSAGGGIELRGGTTAELSGEPIAALNMRLNGDALSDVVLLGLEAVAPEIVQSAVNATFTVINTDGADVVGSFRRAIHDANLTVAADLINFNIPGVGPHNIDLLAPPEAIVQPVTINGYSQSGAQANTVAMPGTSTAIVKIGIDGSLAQGPVNGLILAGSGSSTVRGLAIKDWANGISIISPANIVDGCYLGTAVTGLTSDDNESNGISIASAANNTIGGTTPGARNLISANFDDGVDIRGLGSSGNLVRGNYIGPNVTGAVRLGNNSDGVQCESGPNNQIGGTVAGTPNVIGDNFDDAIDLGNTGNLVQGNLLGTNAAGSGSMSNGGAGVQLTGSNHTIGGTTVAARNIISSNEGSGVFSIGAGTGSLVQGNYIGTNQLGTAAVGNALAGVQLEGAGATIGGTAAGARNIISGNIGRGVLIELSAATGNVVQGNFIGLAPNGSTAMGNVLDGVSIQNAPTNTIGGTAAGAGNVISANGDDGVEIRSASSTGNLVEGNRIGTDSIGTIDLGNTFDGVYIFTSSGNTIGGTTAAARNFISGNNRNGIALQGGGTANRLNGNFVWSNTSLGIDLGVNGKTLNDAGDADSGDNALQNYPVLTLASATPAGALTVNGTLASTASTTYRIEYFTSLSCDSSGNGEGEAMYDTQNVTTDGLGNASVTRVTAGMTASPKAITATATDPAGNTSEFAACRTATCSSKVVFDGTLRALDRTTMGWTPVRNVSWVKGPLSGVKTYVTTSSGMLFSATTLSAVGDNPAPNQGIYYLVRLSVCGSWQHVLGGNPNRDVVLP